jgi:hypothetical protein
VEVGIEVGLKLLLGEGSNKEPKRHLEELGPGKEIALAGETNSGFLIRGFALLATLAGTK